MAETTADAMLKEGDSAPDFEMLSDEGQTIRLADLRGKEFVLYFYPKDDTPGCTTEACNFRDNMGRLQSAAVAIYGVSPDSVKAHVKFREKYGLNFPLLSDEGSKTSTAYGVWKQRSMYGRTYMGIERSTFLVDGNGTIVHAWYKVKPAGHAQEILDYIAERQTT